MKQWSFKLSETEGNVPDFYITQNLKKNSANFDTGNKRLDEEMFSFVIRAIKRMEPVKVLAIECKTIQK